MVIVRKITHQAGFAEGNDASGSPTRVKRPKIVNPKYFWVFSKSHHSRKSINPGGYGLVVIASFLYRFQTGSCLIRFGLSWLSKIWAALWSAFCPKLRKQRRRAYAPQKSWHTEDHAWDPVSPRLLDAFRGGGWSGGGGLWPGEKDSCCEGDFAGSCRKSGVSKQKRWSLDLDGETRAVKQRRRWQAGQSEARIPAAWRHRLWPNLEHRASKLNILLTCFQKRSRWYINCYLNKKKAWNWNFDYSTVKSLVSFKSVSV